MIITLNTDDNSDTADCNNHSNKNDMDSSNSYMACIEAAGMVDVTCPIVG